MSTPLYVVSCISNSPQYKRRYELHREFRQRMEAHPQVRFFTVEMAFGDRPHEVTSPDNPRDIQVRGHTELWHKENLLNIGFSRLPDDWKYACYVDADVTFLNPHWPQATIDKLQHYDVAQMFSTIYDMDPQGNLAAGLAHGYIYNWIARGRKHYNQSERQYTKVGAPGYAWAFTRDAFEKLDGLLTRCPLGSADYYMADAMTGNEIVELTDDMHPEYIAYCYAWRERAQILKQNIGFVNGTIAHHWHGRRQNRGYNWRNRILVEHQYNPYTDVRAAHNGLLILNDEKPGLRDDIRAYMAQRNEDDLYTGKDDVRC